MEEGLAQEPFEDVARALASVARAASGDEVGCVILAAFAFGSDMI